MGALDVHVEDSHALTRTRLDPLGVRLGVGEPLLGTVLARVSFDDVLRRRYAIAVLLVVRGDHGDVLDGIKAAAQAQQQTALGEGACAGQDPLQHQSLQTMGLQAISAVKLRQPVTEVAAALGMNERTVYCWLVAFAEGGQNVLKGLLHDIDGPIFLILDNLSVRKAKHVREFVAAQNGRLKLFFLPPYAPHHNPDEEVWGNVKARVAKQALTNKLRLIQQLTQALEGLPALPVLSPSPWPLYLSCHELRVTFLFATISKRVT
jgi:hypothetical protein